MDPDELYEAIVKTSGARSAIAALLLANDHKGARQRAQHINHEDLISLVLYSAHEYVGAYLTGLQHQLQKQGKGLEQARREARELAMLYFQTEAQMWSERFGQQADGGQE